VSALGAVPLVSCLMITRDRLALAKRAIRCFTDQSYPRLELIVVSAGDRAYRRAVAHHLEHQGVGNARIIAAEPGSSLGALRNVSLDAATGDIVCQWDDDDCYHPDRVLYQVEQMVRQGARACFLTDNLQLLEPDRQLFWINWTRYAGKDEQGEQWRRLFPPTMMTVKDNRFRYPEVGPFAQAGEDLSFAADLCREVPVVMVQGMGWLYLYVFHGENTFSREHYYLIAAQRSFPNEWIQTRSEEIRRAMRYYSTPTPLVVCGAYGPAFNLP
jgi:glycosyltransferase involved in cell wall biosynthesis